MAVKRKLPAGTPSTSGPSETTMTKAGVHTLEDTGSKSELWNSDTELKLFQALIAHTPTGIAKHFQMVLVLNKLSQGK